MKVSEETLMQAGFTLRELGRIKNMSQRSGDTLGEAINDLARRFIIAAVAVTFCLVVFFILLVFGSAQSVIPGALGLACGAAVAAFSQPPVVTYKAWRFRRAQRG
ncbi:hypothetical protein [Pantoea stewartii]|uniref:hypothetical protein n=1 Tax=Pantoea stewartii TaxID=66269 RepID=UPI00197E5EF8|nr:hypothetical protein [Pantoea stewartii]